MSSSIACKDTGEDRGDRSGRAAERSERLQAAALRVAALRAELAAAMDELDQRLDFGDEIEVAASGRAARAGERVVALFRRIPASDPPNPIP